MMSNEGMRWKRLVKAWVSDVADNKVRGYLSFALAICLIMLILLHSRRTNTTSHPQKPEDVIFAMFDAMEKGDVHRYLSLLGDGAKKRAELILKEVGRREFARQLRNMHEGIKGIAVSLLDQVSEDEILLRVELVFESRNEVQKARMKRVNGTWKVVEMMQAEHLTPPILYGTPVDRL